MIMAETTATSAPSRPEKGVYCPAGSGDIRSPCPILNSLANHGYLPRDGRDAHVSDFTSAMSRIGVSRSLGAALSNAVFLEREEDGRPRQRSFLGKLWYLVRNPWAVLFSAFGVRKPGQRDAAGRPCLHLDQLSTPGVVEHDISLSRRDYAQGDNHSMQPDLVKAMLASSSDGGRTLTADDLVAFRKRRIEEQTKENPQLNPKALTNPIGGGEIALFLDVFGDGKTIQCDRVRAIFLEERLPIKEGWTKRWWTVGIAELLSSSKKVKALLRA
jgi:hypothetical protein